MSTNDMAQQKRMTFGNFIIDVPKDKMHIIYGAFPQIREGGRKIESRKKKAMFE
jgi:hypothetical protein